MKLSAPCGVRMLAPAAMSPMNTCALGVQPTDGVVPRMPTTRFLTGRASPVRLSTEALITPSLNTASSPGSATPSGTGSQTPSPGFPGVSQKASLSGDEAVSCGHGCAKIGSLFGSGSPDVQKRSEEHTSELQSLRHL